MRCSALNGCGNHNRDAVGPSTIHRRVLDPVKDVLWRFNMTSDNTTSSMKS